MGLRIEIINKKKISEPHKMQLDDFLNYQEMISYLGYFNLIKKLDIVMAPSNEVPLYIGNCEFMNINYMFNYLLNKTSMPIKLNESIFAGGKGTTLYKVICSSLGEAFERFVGSLEYMFVDKELLGGSYNALVKQGYKLVEPERLRLFSKEQLLEHNFLFDDFSNDAVTTWIKVVEGKSNEEVYFPACLILMYYAPIYKNENRIGYSTSGGLTSHFNKPKGIEHGLTEIIERHEINLSWYCKIPPKRIIVDTAENKKLKSYIDYINEKNILFYRHNVDQENFHVVTAMSFDEDMTKYSFNTGGGIHEDIEKAMLAAVEEYTQAVNNTRKIVYAPKWLTSMFSDRVLNVEEGDDPRKFKTFYQAVSYYGLKCYQSKLDWYVKNNEEVLLSELRDKQEKLDIISYVKKEDIPYYYYRLRVSDMFENIYMSKVYMDRFSPAFIAGVPAIGHYTYEDYIDKDKGFNKDILPFP